MIEERYPSLWRLISSCFHQDWDLEASTWEPLVQRFIATAGAETVTGAARELGQVLQSVADNDELHELVYDELGCAYDPRPNGLEVRDWLEQIRLRLHAASMGGKGSEPAG
ncbi:MAG TPA: contact-dependent growth inhibition system immunity protein [Longimicrobium sp.]|nr:contact-dependent growth inhibition system immunity protein [Longimicrobium sp.]